MLVFKQGARFPFSQLSNLEGRSIAAILGYGYVGDKYFKRVDVPNNQSQLKMLALGRVDAVIIDLYEYRYLAKAYPEFAPTLSQLELGPVINQSDLKMGVHVSKKGLLESVNREIRQMKASGDIARLAERYR